MKTEALIMHGDGRVAVEAIEIPAPGPGEVMVETAFSSISPGTELRCLTGRQPGAPDGGWIPGYSATGIVRECGDGVVLAVGAAVSHGGTQRASRPRMWGGHCRHVIVAESAVFPVAGDLRAASLAKQAAIAHRGFSLGRIRAGEIVVVAGLGLIGQCSARIAHAAGARVVGLDLSERRCAILAALGMPAFSPKEFDVAALIAELGAAADVVIDATGAAGALPSLLEYGAELPWTDEPGEGLRYVMQGSYPETFSVPYDPAFLREVTFHLPRDVRRSDLTAVLNLIAEGQLPLADLIPAVTDPADARALYERLKDPASDVVTGAFGWAGGAEAA